MNENKEQKSLHEFCKRHHIVSSLIIHGIPDQKITEYLAKMPKIDTDKTKKMIIKEESKLSQDQIQYRLALLFSEKINAMHDEQWKEYKKLLQDIPSYLILEKASNLILDYSNEKRPIIISWFDKEDDFIELWEKLEQMCLDLHLLATIDKALHTVRELDLHLQ